MNTTMAANEQLLHQLNSEITQICPDIDYTKLHITIAGIISLYDIKLTRLPGIAPDVREKVGQFLSAKKLEGLSDHTINGYEIELRIFANYIQKPLDQITTNDIRAYLGSFPKLKMSSVSRKLSVLKSFFAWLTDEEFILKDPVRKIKPPKVEQRLPKALTIEELEMVREACVTPRERALIEVFYATGGRLSEIQSLNKEDINHQTMSAVVIGKGNKEREILFSFKAMYHLKKYQMIRLDDDPALFVTERQPFRRLTTRGIQRAVDKIAERSGVKKAIHPHVFRHTFATLTLNNGADLSSVQALLGHSNPATTQVYAQVTAEKKREAYRKHLVQ